MAENPSSLTLPLLITKGMILFPKNQKLIDAGRDFSINAIKISKEKSDSLILIVSQKEGEVENPKAEDVFSTGVLARVISISEREKRLRARVEVIDRVALSNIHLDEEDNCYVADGTMIEPINVDADSSAAIVSSVNHQLEKYPTVINKLPKSLLNLCADNNAALELCYALAAFFDAPIQLKQSLLETNDVATLAENVLTFIKGENTKEQIEKNISDTVRIC